MARIIYIHVPKCGGSSFGAALRLRHLMSQATIALGQGNPALRGEARILDDYARRRDQLHAEVGRGVRMIAGHVQYDADLHDGPARGYAFVTLLRDPVARFVSHYNYLQRRHPSPARPPTLAGFLDTPDALRIASQYLFYFAGHSQTAGRDPAPLIARAVATLERFDVVGDLARPDAFAADLQRLIRTPLPRWKRNAAPAPTQIPDSLRTRIEQLCAPDIAVYRALHPRRAAA